MTMDEFNGVMETMDLRYSIMVCFELNTAMHFMKKAAKYNKVVDDKPDVTIGFQKERSKYLDQFRIAQHNAIESAMFEKDHGPFFEPVVDQLSFDDLAAVNDAVKTWQPVLVKYGVELKTY